MWRWESTKPGRTIIPEASITSAPSTASPGPTAAIRSCSMSTSPSAKSPTSRSSESTIPPLISFLPVGTTLKSVPAGYRSGSAVSSGGSLPMTMRRARR